MWQRAGVFSQCNVQGGPFPNLEVHQGWDERNELERLVGLKGGFEKTAVEPGRFPGRISLNRNLDGPNLAVGHPEGAIGLCGPLKHPTANKVNIEGGVGLVGPVQLASLDPGRPERRIVLNGDRQGAANTKPDRLIGLCGGFYNRRPGRCRIPSRIRLYGLPNSLELLGAELGPEIRLNRNVKSASLGAGRVERRIRLYSNIEQSNESVGELERQVLLNGLLKRNRTNRNEIESRVGL